VEFSDACRTLMLIMLGTMIITSAVWQVVGFALSRLENFILRRLPT
jgi:hypothetical protein